MSYLVQMAGLTVHNFVSAATGIALAVALVRGFARRSAQGCRQFLGRSHALHAVHLAADLHRRRSVLRLAGHAAKSGGLHRHDHAGRRQAGDRPGPGRFAGSDQDDGHQWRRLLQRQLGASLRESQRHHQPGPDRSDLLARRRADQHVRPHGRQPAPGLGDLRRHGPAVPWRRRGRLSGRSTGQPGLRRPARRPDGKRAAGRRQHGRQGSPLRHRQFRAVHGDHDRRLLRRRQHHA